MPLFQSVRKLKDQLLVIEREIAQREQELAELKKPYQRGKQVGKDYARDVQEERAKNRIYKLEERRRKIRDSIQWHAHFHQKIRKLVPGRRRR